ncbi:DUF1366 domain-containing protein [Gemella haemolysans]|uniref:DUF1366 domain-containing protein n=1 Tax=Gemella haemolysans TaxID=1379 RepID=UPI00195AF2AB|nr:DUF1366 domain-containing protein [Gemella haemolysans]VTX71988.1 Uncharacterised protein [Gemella haemolysans]
MATFKKNYARGTYDSNGAVLTTIVSIYSADGGTVIEITLQGDHLSKSEDEIVQLALEQFYQDTYPNRAENERFTKVDEKLKVLDTKLAEMDKMKKELEITQGSLMDLITQISGSLEAEHHEVNSQPKNTTEGGDSNDGNVIRN